MPARVRRLLLVFAALGLAVTYACAEDSEAAGESAVLDPRCAGETAPPSLLVCTGLYSNLRTKAVAANVHAFAPGTPLWSDGADKSRWIELPKRATIDTADPSEWRFPIGTKTWKEFRVAGKRIETRYFEKVSATTWANATYRWNDDESDAEVHPGGDVPSPDGTTYHIPTNDECQQCHRGRRDRLLGFEQVSLGLPGATGYTLRTLVEENRLAVPTNLTLGDDGTGRAAPALVWLHVNCGVTCHNSNPNAIGHAAKMDLRIDPTNLDGRASTDFGARTTTLGVPANSPQWVQQPRILPGRPDESLLVQLISRRDDNNQMPPIASRRIDPDGVARIREWIAAMPAVIEPPPPDAGIPDASTDAPDADAGTDAALDGGGDDAADGSVDAGL